ncbi:MAG: site-2 protease family protein, partial [Campylobacterales bacterium]
VPTSELGGVVTIVKITADASENGWMAVFFFAALISVNLGVLNLLPIPALDGGHIMFNLYEMVMHRAPSEAVLMKLTIAGWGILLGLMSLGLYNDINRLMQ